MSQQAAFELPFLEWVREGEEVEIVRIPEHLDGHLRMFRGKPLRKVRQRLAFAGMQPALDPIA